MQVTAGHLSPLDLCASFIKGGFAPPPHSGFNILVLYNDYGADKDDQPVA